jgi:eukaryotic-like serine/threonine-protein kinase
MSSIGAGHNSLGDGAFQSLPDRYIPQRKIAEGGQGVVLEAFDTNLKCQVAIKGLRHVHDTAVGRARHEAQAIAKVRSENVISVYDVIECDDQVWIVMELVESCSLGHMLREERQLTVSRAAKIGFDIVCGLIDVHKAGVFHRDIKPDNILIREEGSAVITDFGISIFKGATQLTPDGQIVGTPYYLAPELISPPDKGEPPGATRESDLWAVGVILYEMVEGKRPFDGDNQYQIMSTVRQAQFPPMRYAGPLVGLITLLLQKDPSQRASALDAKKQLTAIIESHDGPPPTHHGPPRLLRIPAAVFSVAVLATSAFLLGKCTGDDNNNNETSPTPTATKSFPPASTADNYKDSHPKLYIGVKEDQPGLSIMEKAGNPKGFEADLGRKIAGIMGYKDNEVIFRPVTTANRSDKLAATGGNDHVDIVIATWSIPKDDQEGVNFAGPYYKALRGILVRKDRNYKSLQALQVDPDAEICTARGSIYEKWRPRSSDSRSATP